MRHLRAFQTSLLQCPDAGLHFVFIPADLRRTVNVLDFPAILIVNSKAFKIIVAACLTNAADASRCERSLGRVGRILVPRDG